MKTNALAKGHFRFDYTQCFFCKTSYHLLKNKLYITLPTTLKLYKKLRDMTGYFVFELIEGCRY